MLNGFWFTSDVSVHSTHVWRVYVQSFDCVCWPYLNSKGLSRTENEKKTRMKNIFSEVATVISDYGNTFS